MRNSKYVFQPNKLSIFYHPFYIIRRNLFLAIKQQAVCTSGNLLDFGCGQKPYADLFVNVKSYIGVDILISGHNHENSVVDVFYDGQQLPFADDTFDVVFSSEVLEHVPNMSSSLNEIYRVLKPGGKFIFTMPFLWGEHEEPYDFSRRTTFGIYRILEFQTKFENFSVSKIGYNFESICQLISAHIIENVPKKRFVQIMSLILIVPLNIFGRIISNTFKSRKHHIYHNTITVAFKR